MNENFWGERDKFSLIKYSHTLSPAKISSTPTGKLEYLYLKVMEEGEGGKCFKLVLCKIWSLSPIKRGVRLCNK